MYHPPALFVLVSDNDDRTDGRNRTPLVGFARSDLLASEGPFGSSWVSWRKPRGIVVAIVIAALPRWSLSSLRLELK